MIVISQVDLAVNEVDGKNRVSEPSERTDKKIDDRDIKLLPLKHILTILYVQYRSPVDRYVQNTRVVHTYIVT